MKLLTSSMLRLILLMSHTSPTENQITTHCTFTKNPTIHHQSPNNSQQQSTAESRHYHLTNKPLILLLPLTTTP